ncbi:MAG: hypothetical protein HYS04_16150 [Acidobacteria bacterium]|nr:hypothetical protein [Acidobacteriota bacterium]
MSGLRLVVPAATRDRVVCKPEARKNAVLAFIRGARRTLLLSVFRCDDLEILHELGEAVTRGVRVEALVTGRAKGWGKRLGPLAGCLERMGVRVHRFSRAGMKYHAKFMVADGERALVGTMNLTHRCFRRTRDFVPMARGSGWRRFSPARGVPSGFWTIRYRTLASWRFCATASATAW